MRVLIVGNRYTSNMDVFENKEYRTFKIANALKNAGLSVKVLLINYRNNDVSNSSETVTFSLKSKQLLEHRKQVSQSIKNFSPTLVWFTNGPIVGLVAKSFFSSLMRTTSLYEVLDNYQTYYPSLLFPVTLFDKWMRRRSAYCSYVSTELLKADSASRGKKIVFFNGYNPDIFYPMDKKTCQRELGLSGDVKRIGFTGSLDERVLDNLVSLAAIMQKQQSKMKLVIASNSRLPEQLQSLSTVEWLGSQPLNKVPLVINACDLMIIPNRSDEFTKFCFPSKLMEYVGCDKTFLTTPINTLNHVVPEDMISSFDMSTFFSDIEHLLTNPIKVANHEAYTWQRQIKDKVLPVLNEGISNDR